MGGEPSAGRDSFATTITSPSGEVVASVSGLLAGRKIQSKRVTPVTPAAARAGC